MSNASHRQARLVDRLRDLTESKLLTWKKDDFTDFLSCNFSNYDVVISDHVNAEGTPAIRLRINSHDGQQIDSFTDDDLIEISNPEGIGYWSVMSNLLRTAQRQISGADEAIDSILRDLDDKDVSF